MSRRAFLVIDILWKLHSFADIFSAIFLKTLKDGLADSMRKYKAYFALRFLGEVAGFAFLCLGYFVRSLFKKYIFSCVFVLVCTRK